MLCELYLLRRDAKVLKIQRLLAIELVITNDMMVMICKVKMKVLISIN